MANPKNAIDDTGVKYVYDKIMGEIADELATKQDKLPFDLVVNPQDNGIDIVYEEG